MGLCGGGRPRPRAVRPFGITSMSAFGGDSSHPCDHQALMSSKVTKVEDR